VLRRWGITENIQGSEPPTEPVLKMKFFILLVCTVNQYVTLDCVSASNEDVYAAVISHGMSGVYPTPRKNITVSVGHCLWELTNSPLLCRAAPQGTI